MTALLAAWTVLVGCSGSPPSDGASTPDAPAARSVDVRVGAHGYTPSSVSAAPGEPLRLRFDRPDEANCGNVLVFPATGERHELPVGRVTEVLVTAPASGALAFTCGMGMYEGAVVVSGG